MNTPKALLCLAAALAALSLSPLAKGQDIKFAFEYDGSNHAALNAVDLSMVIFEADGKVQIKISNQSVLGDPGVTGSQPTAARIFFDDRNAVLSNGVFLAGSNSTVNYGNAQSGGTLPGGNNISFKTTFSFNPKNPRPHNGIDPNEFAIFAFNGTLSEVQSAFKAGDLRVGIHVQELGKGDSAAFISVIPEPSTALLGALGTGLLVTRRRRTS